MTTETQWLSLIYTQMAQVVGDLGQVSATLSALLASAEAEALPRSLTLADLEFPPGLGAILGLWRVPLGKQWEFSGMSVVYTSSAQAATRQMSAVFTYPGGRSMRFIAPVTQAANQSNSYEAAPGLVEYSAVRRQTVTIAMPKIVLPEGATVQFLSLSGQTADTGADHSLFVLERSL